MKQSERAQIYAAAAHGAVGQKRKGTDVSYIVHLKNVAEILKTIRSDDEVIAAGWLHDVLEDTLITKEALAEANFTPRVVQLVIWVTDKDDNMISRAERKAQDRKRMAYAPADAQTIKIADMIDNLTDVRKTFSGRFLERYLEEKSLMLEVLVDGNQELRDRALRLLRDV